MADLYESTTPIKATLDVEAQRHYHKMMVSPPFSVKTGELLDLRFQLSVTSDNPLPIMLGWSVRLSPEGNERTGHLLLGAAAMNLTRETHHHLINGSKLVRVDRDWQDVSVELVMWAQRRTLPARALTIEPNGAFLQVLITQPAQREMD